LCYPAKNNKHFVTEEVGQSRPYHVFFELSQGSKRDSMTLAVASAYIPEPHMNFVRVKPVKFYVLAYNARSKK
jgi:hypothetical protein